MRPDGAEHGGLQSLGKAESALVSLHAGQHLIDAIGRAAIPRNIGEADDGAVAIAQNDQMMGAADAIEVAVPLVHLAHLDANGWMLQFVPRHVFQEGGAERQLRFEHFRGHPRAVADEFASGQSAQGCGFPAIERRPIETIHAQAILDRARLLRRADVAEKVLPVRFVREQGQQGLVVGAHQVLHLDEQPPSQPAPAPAATPIRGH